MKRSLIVFAREPLPGKVKSRLAATVGDVVAAELYEAMLLDVLESCRSLRQVEVVLFWDCAADRLPELERRYGFSAQKQTSGDLGKRMQAAFESMFAVGADVCCIIGSDAPDLPPELITQAFEQLESAVCDAVFGPAMDGGYYLLGLREVLPELFAAIPWGGDAVLKTSQAALTARARSAVLLAEWPDIDRIDDLARFSEAGCTAVARLTRQVVEARGL